MFSKKLETSLTKQQKKIEKKTKVFAASSIRVHGQIWAKENVKEKKNNFQVRSINSRQIFCLNANYAAKPQSANPLLANFRNGEEYKIMNDNVEQSVSMNCINNELFIAELTGWSSFLEANQRSLQHKWRKKKSFLFCRRVDWKQRDIKTH